MRSGAKNETKSDSKRDAADPCSAPEHSKFKLLKAAFDVFSKHGFDGATTKLIAQTAQVNEALIMRHFKSKEGLFLAVVEQHITCEPCQLAYPPQKTVADELTKYCEDVYNRDSKKADFLRIVISHSLRDREFAKRLDDELVDKRLSLLHPRLEELKKKKLIRKNVNIEEIELMLKHQIFSAIFFSAILELNHAKQSKEIMIAAAKSIAEGLAP